MLELAKDKKFWERVRTSDDYKRLRDDLLEEYNKHNTEPPRPRSAKEILNNEDHGTYFRNINQLEYAALMALISHILSPWVFVQIQASVLPSP